MRLIKAVEWQAVNSSVFACIAYRTNARQLYVGFRSGSIYRYFDCSADVYSAFLAAESKGDFFSRCIRDKFRYEQVRLRPAPRGAVRADQRRDSAHAAGVNSPIR